ncbi:Peripheral plasma membrane protein CASK [Portunus trituberculatus]|uniref:Peripheral plasma membrane protein CASK n=1 Tax=Portunus trituberculatus TaxID=210409 RepID=A0A5B7KL69_PORTR|nr:Peripheral plasma membrane protein CASK [Portunus trituberculatus]
MDGADLCFEIVKRAMSGFVYSEAVASVDQVLINKSKEWRLVCCSATFDLMARRGSVAGGIGDGLGGGPLGVGRSTQVMEEEEEKEEKEGSKNGVLNKAVSQGGEG